MTAADCRRAIQLATGLMCRRWTGRSWSTLATCLARWTNDLYCSTLHRALHIGNKPQISGAFFVYPDDRAMVRCLDTCQGPKSAAL